jgi:plasmid stabilization system protein ParE
VNYSLLVRVQAKRDLRQAARWYEKRLTGLGRQFVSEVDTVIERIEENPLLYQPVHRDVRRALVHRFPYGVFYRIDQHDVIVFAIVHLNRDVSAWQDRL